MLMASLRPLQQQENSLLALAVALQHPAVAADQRNICTLLQVSKACRAAVQQSAASMLDCSFQVQMSFVKLGKVASFARWLAEHAGLLCTLKIRGLLFTCDTTSTPLVAVLQQLVEFPLQVAASAATSGVGAPLHLQSYSSFVPATARLLAALPAATLTHLDLRTDNSNWFSGLSKLTNLQQLRLDMYDVQPGTVNSYLREISKLQQLTQLQLEGLAYESNMHLLPAQLQHLHLKCSVYATSAHSAQVNLQHLTSLQHLQLRAGRIEGGSALPVNLQSVHLHVQWPAALIAGISSLHQVTEIELTSRNISRQHLEALQHLPQLRTLSLGLQHHQQPLEVAAVWHMLPLCALSISAERMAATMLQQLMQHIVAATRLTKLEFQIDQIDADDNDEDGLAICEQLQPLKHLSNLVMNIGEPDDFTENDAQHLSALVTLTSLELCSNGYGPSIDQAALCLLAVSLTNLISLSINVDGDLAAHEIDLIGALPAVGKLTTLQTLRLQGLSCDEAHRGLQFLTGLSRLCELKGFSEAGTTAMQQFTATIQRQRQGHATCLLLRSE